MRGFKAGSVLILSNNVVRETPLLTADKLEKSVETGARIILEAFKKIEVE